MKYDRSSLINVSIINCTNIEKMMEHVNEPTKMTFSEKNCDIEKCLPITNNNDLTAVENKIQDPDFRSSLVKYYAV